MGARIENSSEEGYARSGRVEHYAAGEAKVRIAASGFLQLARVPLSIDVREGDEVLVVGDPRGEQFITALLDRHDARRKEQLELRGGARAEVAEDAPERLCIYSKDGELLLEFDGESGRARVRSGEGGLDVTSNGDLNLRAAGRLSLDAERIEARARQAASIECGGPAERAGLSISRRGARLFGALVEVLGSSTEIRARHLRLGAKEIDTQAATIRELAGQIETFAETITEKATRTLRSADELAQQTAGRMRTLVSGTYQLKSRKALLRAQRDFKVNADQIHLG